MCLIRGKVCQDFDKVNTNLVFVLTKFFIKKKRVTLVLETLKICLMVSQLIN